MHDAFQVMLAVNAAYEQVEITGNFIMGEALAPEHYQSLANYLNTVSTPSDQKGAI